MRSNKNHVEFKIKIGEDKYDEVMDYAQVVDHINREKNNSSAVADRRTA